MAPEQQQPPQHQDQQPGRQGPMNPQPKIARRDYKGSDKLKDKVALITGGDSGIGQSTAVLFAREGADVAIVYLAEDEDAQKTKQLVEGEGRRCLTIRGDVGDESFCRQAVDQTVKEFGKLDILVNNAAEQHPKSSLEEITAEQLEKTFRTNIFAYFFMAKAALPHLKEGSSIINTTSVTAYKGSPQLLDYSSTKGAIVAFTRSLEPVAGGKEHPGQRRGAGTDLDPADPLDLPGREGREVRRRRAAGTRRPAGGSGALLRLPGVGRRLLHDRSGAAPQRRLGRQRLGINGQGRGSQSRCPVPASKTWPLDRRGISLIVSPGRKAWRSTNIAQASSAPIRQNTSVSSPVGSITWTSAGTPGSAASVTRCRWPGRMP